MTSNVSRTVFPLAAAILAAASGGSAAWAGTGIWTPVGPGVGDVTAIVTHAGSPGVVWIGLPAGGVYESIDQGAAWSWMGRPLAGSGVSALAADPGTAAGLWAATQDGFFHTTNGGASWSQVSDASYAAALGGNSPNVMTASGGVLFIEANDLEGEGGGRLLASSDGGASWLVAYDAAQGHWLRAMGAAASGAGGVYIAVVGSEFEAVKLLESVDGGRSWTTSAGPWDQSNGSGISQIAVSPSAVYVATDEDTLLRSTDGGATWETVLGGGGELSYVVALTADPRAPHTLWVADEGNDLWITRDDGATWRRRQLPDPPPYTASLLAVDPEAHALYIAYASLPGYGGTPGSLWRSRDGGASWQAMLLTPLDFTPPARVSWRAGDQGQMAMSVGGQAYLSANGGRTWSWLPVPFDVRDLDLDPSDPNRLIAASDYAVALSKDGGRTWSYAAYTEYLETLVRADRRTLFASGCGIQRSADRGKTWRIVLPCRWRDAKTLRYVQKIEIDAVHPESVYALTFLVVEGFLIPTHGVLAGRPSILWRSDDGGVTWKKAAEGLRAFALDPAGSRLYAIRESTLLRSDDGGAHWQTVAAAPPGLNELLADPTGPAAFFATDGDGMLRSRDGGSTWQRFNRSAVPKSYQYGSIFSLVLSPEDPHDLYAICDGAILHFAFPQAP
jgi:photosystem II stability/assembly factor-like uncharacterized protein